MLAFWIIVLVLGWVVVGFDGINLIIVMANPHYRGIVSWKKKVALLLNTIAGVIFIVWSIAELVRT